METIQPLQTLEAILAQHRAFGNSDYIHEQLHICYKRRLTKISASLPSAGQLLEALGQTTSYSQYRILGDTVVRCAIQHAFMQSETGTQYGLPLDECKEVFRATVRHLAEGKREGPLASGFTQIQRLGPEAYHGWIWNEEHPNDIFGRSFRYLIQEEYGESLCTPDADELAMLVKGAQLLGELLPALSHSALSHAHLIAVFPEFGLWKGKASSSQFRLGGTIFLNRKLLQSPWWIAEHLFHEALHHKLYDFRHGHSVLEAHAQGEDEPKVCSVWNPSDANKSNCWDTDRAVAAFHVYVHLAFLSTVAEQRAPELENIYGPLRGPLTMIESHTALERAHYLGEQIKAVCWQELGLAGKHLVGWLIQVLDVLDSSPPPKGSYLHLLLGLYQREAKMIEFSLGPSEVSSDILQQLTGIIQDEVASVQRVLSLMDAEAAQSRFSAALTQYSDSELGTHFAQVRRLISETLLHLSPNGYELRSSASESKNPDEMVKHMVENSSQRLSVLRAQRVPALRK